MTPDPPKDARVGTNVLYYGDNREILPGYVKDETVDLVYLDPPFNSNRSYNVLFAERDGTDSTAQIKVFEDTWKWNRAAAELYDRLVEYGGTVSQAIQAFRQLLGTSDMLAYLTNMAPTLIELHGVLKPTGTLYLHCDPTASHYLKLLLDSIFGPRRFMNEVCWKRSSAHSDTKQGMRRYGKIRDLLLVYTKSDEYTWNPLYTPYTAEYLETEYRHIAPDGRRYKEADATGAKPGGDTEFDWPVKRPTGKKDVRWVPDLDEEFRKPKPGWEYRQVRPYEGRYWAYSKANLIQFWKEGRLIHRSTGAPRLMLFADEMPGIPLQDLWLDIPPELGDLDLGYPTQKPEELLERIIRVSSNEGDLVLDPFCGCGTAISVAQRLNRRWIGIDITHLAVSLIRHRLDDAFGSDVQKTYKVVGEPITLEEARALAAQDPYQFQWWAVGKVSGRPVEQKKGADRGIDGRLYFHDEPEGGKTKQIILSVKAGHVNVSQVRDLRGVIEREGAEIGVLLCLEKPTKEMLSEAAAAGFYKSPWGKHPRIQIVTIEDLLKGRGVDRPPSRATMLRRAPTATDMRDYRLFI